MNLIAGIDQAWTVLVVAGLGIVFFLIKLSPSWLQAKLNGMKIPASKLIAMQLRSVPCSLIIKAGIIAQKAGASINWDNLEAHYLAGGNVVGCVQAIITAKNAGWDLDWNRACAIDLASKGIGQTITDIIRTSLETNRQPMAVFNDLRRSMNRPPL